MSEPFAMQDSPAESSDGVSRPWLSERTSLVRQAILDRHGQVHGYELVFEDTRIEREETGSQDTLAILDNIVLCGLDRLTGGSRAFLSCQGGVPSEDMAPMLPVDKTVLQIPAAMEMPPNLRTACEKLRRLGFRFALADVTNTRAAFSILDLVHYAKLDIGGVESSDWASLRRRLKSDSKVMVATGVHSHDSYRRAQAEGFTYFQGLYFCRPEPLKVAGIPANRMVHVEILQELFKDPLNLQKLCPLVMREVSLVCHVLRLVNSPVYAIREPITSIESALLILGDMAFRRIAILAIQCALNTGRSPAILQESLVRAHFCAESASLCNLDTNEQYLLGLLSMLPAMIAVPMELIIPELPLRDQLRHALLGSPIHERCLLDWIECHEAKKSRECEAIADHFQLDRTKLMHNYMAALDWAEEEPALSFGSTSRKGVTRKS